MSEPVEVVTLFVARENQRVRHFMRVERDHVYVTSHGNCVLVREGTLLPMYDLEITASEKQKPRP